MSEMRITFCRKYPKLQKFRQKGPQNLEQLDRIFRDVAATGVVA